VVQAQPASVETVKDPEEPPPETVRVEGETSNVQVAFDGWETLMVTPAMTTVPVRVLAVLLLLAV